MTSIYPTESPGSKFRVCLLHFGPRNNSRSLPRTGGMYLSRMIATRDVSIGLLENASSSREGIESASDEGNESAEAVQDFDVNSLQDNGSGIGGDPFLKDISILVCSGGTIPYDRETDIISEAASSLPVCLEVNEKNPIKSAPTLPKDSNNVLCGKGQKGVGEDHKRSWVKRLCTENKVHFLGLQETMTSKVDEFQIKELWNNSPFCFASKNSNGKSGGIIAIWDTFCLSSIGTLEGDCFLAIKGTWQSLETSCLMIIMYAPQSQAKKTKLWSKLTNLILEHDNLTIVMGDFNKVRSSSERMGFVFNQNGALKFNEFIANTGLMDLPLGRKRFTIINKHGSKLSKLDRIMVSRYFVDKWPQANLDALTRLCGDKAPGPDGFTFKFIKNHWDLLVDDPNVIGDFIPISLIGCQYKILAKVLANRLAQMISLVVSEVQMRFTKGHQITDGPLIVEEILSWAKKQKKRFLFFKVDFEKTFDTLSWSFLDSIMSQMGFSSKWRNWIKACLNWAYASVLINGSSSKEFKVKRGFRQGDPLSLFLFILAVKALNVILVEAKNKNKFHGLPICANMSRCANWSPLIDRFLKRLSIWKSKTLSFGGRLTLIKSVLGGLGVYYFFTFKAPKKIIDKLESIRRNFFWGASLVTKRISWIPWDKALSSLNQGGLGICSLKIFRLEVNKNCLVRDRAPIVPQHHIVSFSGAATTGPHTLGSMGLILPPCLHFHWTWSRPLRSKHEIDELNKIVSLLSNLHLLNSHDTWECYLNHSPGFSVNLIRKHIILQSHNLSSQLFKWINLVPIKVNINTWRILNQRMPTRINLDHRGIDLNSVRCPIYDEDVETEEHIFVHCNLARKI
nr:hypothetical protein [Tanacetum cinerariifolium]